MTKDFSGSQHRNNVFVIVAMFARKIPKFEGGDQLVGFKFEGKLGHSKFERGVIKRGSFAIYAYVLWRYHKKIRFSLMCSRRLFLLLERKLGECNRVILTNV